MCAKYEQFLNLIVNLLITRELLQLLHYHQHQILYHEYYD